MLTSWANHIVLAALGLSLGGVARLTLILTPPAWEEILGSRKVGEGFFRGARRRADEQAALVLTGPRPFRLAARAQLGVLVVLVLTLWLSPAELGWWTIALSIAAGAGLVDLVYRVARSGRVRLRGPSFLDPLAGVRLNTGASQNGQASPPA